MAPTRLVKLIAGSFVVCSIISACLYVFETGHLGLDQVIRMIVIIMIAWPLIKGWNFGRWLAIFVMGFAGAITLFSGLVLIQESIRGVPYILIGICTGIGVATLFTPYVGLHFNQQNEDAEQAVDGNPH
jgi:hypothetical protein